MTLEKKLTRVNRLYKIAALIQVINKFYNLLTKSKMNSHVDYTPILLAQLTDLQTRVTVQDTLIAALKTEVERLAGHSIVVTNTSTMRTSVPLRPNEHHNGARVSHVTRNSAHTSNAAIRSRPKVVGSEGSHKYPTVSLSDVLKKDENVTIQVGTGKGADGIFIYTTAEAVFDGTDLVVSKCELVESLVGMKSSKPGEILYKFIDELKSAGHINKTFAIAPWRLCSVVRDGTKMTLEQLRSTVG